MPEKGPIEGFIEQYRQSQRPNDRFITKSLEELFLSGRFRTASVSREFVGGDPSRVAESLALVVIRGERLQGVFLAIDNREDLAKERAEKIDQFVEEEWNNRHPMIRRLIEENPEFYNNNVKRLMEHGLQTLAGVQMSTSVNTGSKLIEFLYPRLFRPDVPYPGLTEDMKDEGALAIALYFLRRGRFSLLQRAFEH